VSRVFELTGAYEVSSSHRRPPEFGGTQTTVDYCRGCGRSAVSWKCVFFRSRRAFVAARLISALSSPGKKISVYCSGLTLQRFSDGHSRNSATRQSHVIRPLPVLRSSADVLFCFGPWPVPPSTFFLVSLFTSLCFAPFCLFISAILYPTCSSPLFASLSSSLSLCPSLNDSPDRIPSERPPPAPYRPTPLLTLRMFICGVMRSGVGFPLAAAPRNLV
jgi:hypothetical protein